MLLKGLLALMAIVTESMATRARKKAVQRILVRTLVSICVLAILAFIAFSVLLHMWAANFDRTANALVQELAAMRIGATAKRDALQRIPELERTPRSEEDGREVYQFTIQNSVSYDRSLREIGRHTGRVGYAIAYLYGVRHWSVSGRVDFQNGVVSDLAYRARVSSADPGRPAGVTVNVGSLQSFDGVPVTAESVASPEYRVTNFAQWPEQDITVAFTENAPHDLIRHAFNLNLGCISELRGCSKAEQMLPDAMLDKRVIMKSAGLE